MKDKKGFTLIELLAVIILIGVLSVLVVPNVIDSINKSDQKLFVLQEQEVEDAAKIYIEDYCLSPIEDSYVCPLSHTIFSGELLYSGEIDLNVLVANNYIDEVSLKGKSCIGSVVVTNNKPDALLACGEKFISEGILNYKLMAHYPFDDFQEPTVNLIPNSPINSYPKIGNSHGTYNDYHFNNNTYFSIGTIGSVTDNVVTLSTIGRAIYTYDVLTPQTSGGGVTAGTNYFIKKISSNSFTLHSYDNTPDGSKGFAVHNSILNDQRISINATDFPTMWWGRPHLPNSSLVKEIILDCFTSSTGSKHECIRLNTSYRTDGGTDGMAYAVTPAVTVGKVYTISFYYKAANTQTVGKSIRLHLYTPSSYWSGDNVSKTINSATEWQRYEITLTAPTTGNTSLYFFPQKGADVEISEILFEEKPYSTEFTETTRTGIVDDKSVNNYDAPLVLSTTPKWVNNGIDSTGAYEFNGTNSYINVGNGSNINLTNIGSISLWAKTSRSYPSDDTSTKYKGIISKTSGGGINTTSYFIDWNGTNTTRILRAAISNGSVITAVNISDFNFNNKWTHIVFTWDGNNLVLYINGVETKTASQNGTNAQILSKELEIGRAFSSNAHIWDGSIDDVRIYNRALSESEVKALYNMK